ncbi:PREDICTED: uncharacterized protein LOC108621591 [Drosophila arizonae]|uniref:Uncharacterized protein LOC108621591 n=1 Tax=Drosophila arizonae TaxID=7263 RepID=A0ABM1Q4W3_DROAR|nr:PREDICTED: uncharacterized protein LOC108621591 [Drosophila arizonae]
MVCHWVILLWTISWTGEANSSDILQLLSNIKHQEHFNYMLLMKHQNNSEWRDLNDGQDFVKSLIDHLQTPVIQLDEHVTYFLYDKNSNIILTVALLRGTDFEMNKRLLDSLVKNLRVMTVSRVVFMVQLEQVNEIFLYELFTYCWENRLLNVLAIFEDYELTNTFYSYSPFPSYQLEQRVYDPNSIIFPDRFRDLQGFKVRAILGGATPRIIIYYNKQGDIVYKGTLGHFMEVFQQKFNCTLMQPIPLKPDVLLPSADLVAAVRNNTVDISLAITFPEGYDMLQYTYPYEQLNWCVMLPVEADIPRAEYYINVFDLGAFLLTLATISVISLTLSGVLRQHGYSVQLYEFILHDNCLRGVLGQSFYQVRRASLLIRATYMHICVLGFLVTAWYNSYFSAFVTSIPKEAPFRTYDDILASKIKVLAWEGEYNELIARAKDLKKYERMFLVEPNFNKFLRMRDSWDTSQGYMMTTIKWVVINAQQSIFSRPLFRMRNDFCFFNNIPLGFPVNENAIYKQPIARLILQLTDAGIVSYWTKNGFSEMVESGELKFSDLSPRRDFQPMQLQDLQYVWYGYAFMVVFSSIVLLLEMFWNRLKLRRQRKSI